MHDSNEFRGSFLIADLTGYTALTEAHGDFSAAQTINRYNEIVKGLLTKDVKIYQQVGDEIFLISFNPKSLIHYAIKLISKVEKESHFPSIHAGLHHGTVIKQDEKIFGAAINLTSRIASYAQAGKILCSKSFKDSVKDLDISFKSLGEKKFKNVVKTVEIFEIKTNLHTEEVWYTDPVCRMHISENTAPAKLPFKKKTIYFCSFECAKNFILHPELYKDLDHE
jgi:class 3 adenylate cyclase